MNKLNPSPYDPCSIFLFLTLYLSIYEYHKLIV